MDNFSGECSIDALTAEIDREKEPEELVDDIMLAIFGADAVDSSQSTEDSL